MTTTRATRRGPESTARSYVKRITLLDVWRMGTDGGDGQLRQVNLVGNGDPSGLGGHGPGEPFTFQGIESVVVDGPDHALVVNGSNLPFASG